MYIPVSYFSTLQIPVTASGGITGSYLIDRYIWRYHQFDASTYTTSSFNVISGSIIGKLFMIGGGGAGGYGEGSSGNGGGGGGGGINLMSQFRIVSGSYEVVVGYGGTKAGTSFNIGSNGGDSYIKPPYQTEYIRAKGGGGGGASTSLTVANRKTGSVGGSGGGNAQCIGGTAIAMTAGDGGFPAGGIDADNASWNGQWAATGGGGAGGSSKSIVQSSGSFPFPAAATDGGIGWQNDYIGTSSYYGGGGAAYSKGTNTLSTPGLGSDNWGGGGSGFNATNNGSYQQDGIGGAVIIAYPAYFLEQPPLITDGLVLWNNSGSYSSSIWYDASGNGNHAIVSGSAQTSSGSYGWTFNGTDNYLTYPTTLTATPSSSWSMIWYGSFYDDGVNRDMFTKDYFTNGWDTLWDAVGTLDIVFRDQIGQDAVLVNSYVAPNKTIYTLTIDATTDSLKLYKNDTLVSTASKTVNNFNANPTEPFRFGWNSNPDGTYFKGAISDLLIYNKVLSLEEVQNNYLYFTL